MERFPGGGQMLIQAAPGGLLYPFGGFCVLEEVKRSDVH